MNEKKNIDRLFQEKFKDFEVAPNDAVWNRISDSLPNKKKKRRVIALWWQIGGVAAVLALLFTVGVSIFNSNPDPSNDPTIVNTEGEDAVNDTTNPSSTDKQNKINNGVDLNDSPLVDSNNGTTTEEDYKEQSSQEKYHSNKLNSADDVERNKIANAPTPKEEKTLSNKPSNLTKISDKNGDTRVAANTDKSNNTTKNPNITDEQNIKSVIKETIKNENTAITDNTSSNNPEVSNSENNEASAVDPKNDTETALNEDPKKESILDAIADNSKDTDEKEKDDEQNRWSIAPNVAPVYYSSLGEGSSIDQQFNSNSKSSDINMSYGITGSYNISKKLKVRAGINRVNLSQSTSDVFAFNGGEFASRNATEAMGNITPRAGLGNITLMSANIFDRTTTPEVFNTTRTGNIDQRFGFIEVPLELEYRVLDNKFGLNLIGGFSTFFLSQNEIFADIDGNSTLIGEASNINSTSFSANFGLGLDYRLSRQWNLNLEPQFKYQINTFNNTSGNFRPFFIGLYTGLSYKF